MGDSHAWPDTCAWKPRCTAVHTMGTQQTDVNWCLTCGKQPEGHANYADWFEKWHRLPMCSLLWGTAMHGRTSVHDPPCVTASPPFRNQMKRRQLKLNTLKTTERHALTDPDACERRIRLPMCGYSWGTAMHGRRTKHDNNRWNPHAWLSALLKLNQ